LMIFFPKIFAPKYEQLFDLMEFHTKQHSEWVKNCQSPQGVMEICGL